MGVIWNKGIPEDFSGNMAACFYQIYIGDQGGKKKKEKKPGSIEILSQNYSKKNLNANLMSSRTGLIPDVQRIKRNNSIIVKQRIKIYLIQASVFHISYRWKNFSKIMKQFNPRSIKTMHTWVTVLQSSIYEYMYGNRFCVQKIFAHQDLSLPFLSPSYIFFFSFKTTKTYILVFQGTNFVFFFTGKRANMQIKSLWCISESSLLAFSILTLLFKKEYRNKIFSKVCASQSSLRHVLSHCYIFLGIYFF